MKILYLIKSFANKAGTERVISDKINYLAGMGYDITLVTYEQGQHAKAFELHPSVRFVDLQTRFFTIQQLPFYKRLFSFCKLRKLFRVRLQNLVNEFLPDIIISTTYSIDLLDVVLSVKTTSVHVVESHVACFSVKKSYEHIKYPLLWLFRIYDNYVLGQLRKCHAVVALTEGDALEWRRFNSNVRVIPNPLTYYPKTVCSQVGTGKRIICVGRLNKQKGFDLLLEAFSLIEAQCPDWHIDIYGDGGEKEFLDKIVVDKCLNKRVKILAPTSSIYDEYQNSEFLVLSSRYEGFGLVLIEAMSCGLPCVSFKCKYGPEDIITHGKDGLLAHDGDVQDLAEQMLWLIQHKEERIMMGQEARKSARRYDKEKIMPMWKELFESLVKK